MLAFVQDDLERSSARERLALLVHRGVLAGAVLHSYDLTTVRTHLLASQFLDALLCVRQFYVELDGSNTIERRGLTNIARSLGDQTQRRPLISDLFHGPEGPILLAAPDTY